MDIWLEDVKLAGQHARLSPLREAHGPELAEALGQGALHELWYTTVPAPEAIPAEIARRLSLRATGSMLPFAVCDASSGRAVGMTTFMNIDAENRRVEIGSTFYAASVQRSGINTEAKLMLLKHAFETLKCNAVEFRTHRLNRQSRQAIERLGAQLDGILRAHIVLPNGTLRDTAVYSIIAPEWPVVKANLTHLLARHG